MESCYIYALCVSPSLIKQRGKTVNQYKKNIFISEIGDLVMESYYIYALCVSPSLIKQRGKTINQ